MSAAATEVPAGATTTRLGVVTEWLLAACVLLAGGLALTARAGLPEGTLFDHVGVFYRVHLVGALTDPGRGAHAPLFRVVPWFVVPGLLGVVLLGQMALPKLAPEVRGGTVALALLLLLAPVLSYGPEVELFGYQPDEVAILAGANSGHVYEVPTRFDPLRPVGYPLAAALVLLVAWLWATPRTDWPTTFTAFAWVTALLVLTDLWLTRMLLRARGKELMLDFTQWPHSVAAAWLVLQVGVAVVASAAACRNRLVSRLLAGLTAVLLFTSAALLRSPA